MGNDGQGIFLKIVRRSQLSSVPRKLRRNASAASYQPSELNILALMSLRSGLRILLSV